MMNVPLSYVRECVPGVMHGHYVHGVVWTVLFECLIFLGLTCYLEKRFAIFRA